MSEVGSETFDFPIAVAHRFEPAASVDFLLRGRVYRRLVIGFPARLRFRQSARRFRRQLFGGWRIIGRYGGFGQGLFAHAINLGRPRAIG